MSKDRKKVRKRAEELPPLREEELRALDASLAEVDIDYSDLPPIDPARILAARAEQIASSKTRAVSIRVEEAVLDWFKRQGPGYQTRMRQVLREHMLKSLATQVGRSGEAAADEEEVELTPLEGRDRKPRRYVMRRGPKPPRSRAAG